jgi:hypothetical protein
MDERQIAPFTRRQVFAALPFVSLDALVGR